MEKITPTDIPLILNRPTIRSSENELKQIFYLLGLRLKEFHAGKDSYCFEVHYHRTYIIQLYVDHSRLGSFSNEYVNFGDGSHGVSMPLDNLKDTILIIFNLFMNKMGINYDGTVALDDDCPYTEEELQPLVEAFNTHLLSKQDN